MLTASHNLTDEDGLGTVSYQWLRDGQAITGATGNAYAPDQADVGHAITVKARHTDLQGTAEAVTSSATVVQNLTSADHKPETFTIRSRDGTTHSIGITVNGADEPVTSTAPTDVIYGPGGKDVIFGGAGADQIFGNTGDDDLYGNAGVDKLWGQAGAARFFFGADDMGTNARRVRMAFGLSHAVEWKDLLPRRDVLLKATDPEEQR